MEKRKNFYWEKRMAEVHDIWFDKTNIEISPEIHFALKKIMEVQQEKFKEVEGRYKLALQDKDDYYNETFYEKTKEMLEELRLSPEEAHLLISRAMILSLTSQMADELNSKIDKLIKNECKKTR